MSNMRQKQVPNFITKTAQFGGMPERKAKLLGKILAKYLKPKPNRASGKGHRE